MAIVMLASFDPQDLPGVHPARLFPLMDTGSYREAWSAVRHVASNCISPFVVEAAAGRRTVSEEEEEGKVGFVSETGYGSFGMVILFMDCCGCFGL